MKAAMVALFAVAYFCLCALLDQDRWFLLGLSYALLWPPIFAFAIIPAALVGTQLGDWKEGIALTEIVTIVVAILFFSPSLETLFRRLFGEQLIMTHLSLFPPLLLSILIGHFGKSRFRRV